MLLFLNNFNKSFGRLKLLSYICKTKEINNIKTYTMKTQELKNYFETTRDENELSFTQWCLDHEWYEKENLWFCLADEEKD